MKIKELVDYKLSINIFKNFNLIYPLTFVFGNPVINLSTILIILLGLISF